MKNIRLMLLMILVMFSCTFLLSIDKSKAIYRETKSTTVYVSVTNNSSVTVTLQRC